MFLLKDLRCYGRPEEISTDRPTSHRTALRDLGVGDLQHTGRWLNNRVENSPLPLRRRERAMLRLPRMRRHQNFAEVHASVLNHVNRERSLSSREHCKGGRAAALAEWRQFGAA